MGLRRRFVAIGGCAAPARGAPGPGAGRLANPRRSAPDSWVPDRRTRDSAATLALSLERSRPPKPMPGRPIRQRRHATCPPISGASSCIDRIPATLLSCASHAAQLDDRMFRSRRCQVHSPGAVLQAHRSIRDEYGKASSSRPFRPNHSDNEIMRCRCECIEHASPHRASSATARQAKERRAHPLSARRRSRDDVRRPTGSSPVSASGTNARGRSRTG